MPFPFNPSMSINYDASKLVNMNSNKVTYSKNVTEQNNQPANLNGHIAQENKLENLSLNDKLKEIETENYANVLTGKFKNIMLNLKPINLNTVSYFIRR